ncbi:hypothetical protein [Leptolyngbya sp. GB1-A1]|uniref:hypothetical protein n=1 Tax=unclassified Leptolyngbya TaxID=2650499 RepID=UPI0019C25FD0|nr:hypothetical protein [Cyanobacteria bacterium FACHB-502]
MDQAAARQSQIKEGRFKESVSKQRSYYRYINPALLNLTVFSRQFAAENLVS